MEEILYYVLAALGLLFFGAGAAGVVRSKIAKAKKPAPTPAPVVVSVPVVSVPSKAEVDALNVAAATTTDKVKELSAEEDALKSVPASTTKPDPKVVSWLASRK